MATKREPAFSSASLSGRKRQTTRMLSSPGGSLSAGAADMAKLLKLLLLLLLVEVHARLYGAASRNRAAAGRKKWQNRPTKRVRNLFSLSARRRYTHTGCGRVSFSRQLSACTSGDKYGLCWQGQGLSLFSPGTIRKKSGRCANEPNWTRLVIQVCHYYKDLLKLSILPRSYRRVSRFRRNGQWILSSGYRR